MVDHRGKTGGIVSQAKQLIPIFSETAADWVNDKATRLSAALSLYTILSLAPLLVITLKVVGLVLRNKDHAHEQMTTQLTGLMGPQAAEAIKPMIESGGKPGQGVLAATISIALLVFSATGVFIELQDSMNTIWGVEPKPHQGVWGFIRNRLLSAGMVFGIAFLLLISMFVSTVLASLAKFVAGDTKWLAFTVDAVGSCIVVTMLFAAIFKFLPDVKIRWKYVWVGAVLTAGLFIVGKYGMTLYFKYATPTSAFGAAGSLAAVLIWIYYSAFILFFGAEFTKVWARHHGHQIEPAENATIAADQPTAAQAANTEPPSLSYAPIPLPAYVNDDPATFGAPPQRVTPVTFIVAGVALAGGAAITHLLEAQRRTARDLRLLGLTARLQMLEDQARRRTNLTPRR